MQPNDNCFCPGFPMPGPATAQGKAGVAAGLGPPATRMGKAVSVFKCGQDFRNPLWLALARVPGYIRWNRG